MSEAIEAFCRHHDVIEGQAVYQGDSWLLAGSDRRFDRARLWLATGVIVKRADAHSVESEPTLSDFPTMHFQISMVPKNRFSIAMTRCRA